MGTPDSWAPHESKFRTGTALARLEDSPRRCAREVPPASRPARTTARPGCGLAHSASTPDRSDRAGPLRPPLRYGLCMPCMPLAYPEQARPKTACPVLATAAVHPLDTRRPSPKPSYLLVARYLFRDNTAQRQTNHRRPVCRCPPSGSFHQLVPRCLFSEATALRQTPGRLCLWCSPPPSPSHLLVTRCLFSAALPRICGSELLSPTRNATPTLTARTDTPRLHESAPTWSSLSLQTCEPEQACTPKPSTVPVLLSYVSSSEDGQKKLENCLASGRPLYNVGSRIPTTTHSGKETSCLNPATH